MLEEGTTEYLQENKREEFWVSQLGEPVVDSYNMTYSGGLFLASDAMRKKMSVASLRNWESQERRDKLRARMMGNQHAKGSKRTQETRDKISRAGKGRKFSQAHKDKIAVALKGNRNGEDRVLSEEILAKRRAKDKTLTADMQAAVYSLMRRVRKEGRRINFDQARSKIDPVFRVEYLRKENARRRAAYHRKKIKVEGFGDSGPRSSAPMEERRGQKHRPTSRRHRTDVPDRR